MMKTSSINENILLQYYKTAEDQVLKNMKSKYSFYLERKNLKCEIFKHGKGERKSEIHPDNANIKIQVHKKYKNDFK